MFMSTRARGGIPTFVRYRSCQGILKEDRGDGSSSRFSDHKAFVVANNIFKIDGKPSAERSCMSVSKLYQTHRVNPCDMRLDVRLPC